MSTVAASDNFRTNLRAVIQARDLSQRQIAEIAETGYSYVNRVLRGHTDPSFPQAERLAEAVGLTLQQLLVEPEVFSKRFLQPVA